MELNVIGGSPVQVSETVFNRPYSEALVHQVVVAYLNAGRAGTKAQKTRSEVTGTTKKFKKQKGGGARHGDYRAPIFVGGGVTFAAKPRSFAQKVNRKMYRGAIKAIFSELLRQGRLKIVGDLALADAKTKSFVARMSELGVVKGTLIDVDVTEALHLASRNVPNIHVVDVEGLNPASLVRADQVVLTVPAVKKLEEWLS